MLFCVHLFHGMLVLATFSSELHQTSTRPFSNVTMEDSSLSKIKDIRISPDLEVVYVLDSGLGQTLRMELASGNCRSLGKKFHVRTLIENHLLIII